MTTGAVSRRRFLGAAASSSALVRLAGPAALAAAQAACTARDEGAAFETLTPSEAREIEAFSARILPTTDTPGAREAGVVYFFDKVLGDHMAGMLDAIRGTLPAFQAGIGERFPGAAVLSDLDEADQDAWIAANEDSPFFAQARMLTLIGFFAMAGYGGNRDHLSWKLIEFEGHSATQPPFGHYDREYAASNRGQTDGA